MMFRDIRVFYQLFLREIYILRKEFIDNLIDGIIWPVMSAMIYGYILPAMGISLQYGSFLLIGVIVSAWFYTVFEYSFLLAQDFDNNRLIDFQLGLPISPWMVLIKYGCAHAFHSFMITFPLLFIGKLFLYNRFDMTNFSFIKYLTMSVLGNLVFAFFALWVAGWAKSSMFVHVRTRLFDPLFFMGCYMSTWATMAQVFPLIAYVMLCNPVTYAMEATRIAVFGQKGYLNEWVCYLFLISQLFFWGWRALCVLRRRLDYVPMNWKSPR